MPETSIAPVESHSGVSVARTTHGADRVAGAGASAPCEPMDATEAAALLGRIRDNLERVIRGKREALDLVLCAVAGGGHILLEDIPGTGKTTLARALAQSMGCSFKRIQFTPDL